MNKKYIVYSGLMMSLVACNLSFSMSGKLFKLARFVGVTHLPALGLYQANEDKKKIQALHEAPLVPEVIAAWGKEKAERLNIFNAESLSFRYGDCWSTEGNTVFISRVDARKLRKALELEAQSRKESAKWYSFGLFEKDYQKIEKYNKKIAQDAMILKHEFGHVAHNDSQSTNYIIASSFIGVEALSFGATSTFNKVFNRQFPKTLLRSVARSSLSIGAILPKLFINIGIISLCKRHQETEADRFACENAESRLELEEYANLFRKRKHGGEVDFPLFRIHPLNNDRVAMIESYLPKWDAEHADKSFARAIERS